MKKYQSHKVIEAAKVTDVTPGFNPPGSDSLVFRLKLGTDPLEFIDVEKLWVLQHAPGGEPATLIGGYVVSYPNEHISWSPASAFEAGYRELVHDPKDGALPVSGYKPQTSSNVTLVNGNKQAEELTLRLLDALESYPGIDRRWLAIGRTDIEKGWMFVNRAVFKPGRVTLPDDGPPVPSAPPPHNPVG